MAKKSLSGNKVRRLRRELGLAQVEMAKRLGISPSYLNLIEHNQRPLTLPVLLKLAESFDVDLRSFSKDEDTRLLADLTEVFIDPLFTEYAIDRETVNRVVETTPSVGQAVGALYRAYRNAREDVMALSEQLSEATLLSTSTHELRTLLTSVRSFSEILRDHADLGTEQRQQFLDVLAAESGKLSSIVDEILEFATGDILNGLAGTPSPVEEVTDFIQARGNYFPAVEAAAEAILPPERPRGPHLYHGLVEMLATRYGVGLEMSADGNGVAGHRHYDASARKLVLSELLSPASRAFQVARQIGLLSCAPLFAEHLAEARLASSESKDLCRDALANYFAGAVLMPYPVMLDAAREVRYDIELLQRRFGVSFEQVCHRLTTLQSPQAPGIPFHFLRVDMAGNISKRFSASGLHIARYGGVCPLANVHAAFMTPGHINVQVARMPDGTAYLNMARTVTRPGGSFKVPRISYAIGLGCELLRARELVYSDGLDLQNPGVAVPIGVNCRLCERTNCQQRAAPPIVHRTNAAAARRGRDEGVVPRKVG